MTESTGDRPACRQLKPPNRKKYEEDLEKLNVTVREKEEELKSLDVRSHDKVQTEINKLHFEREEKFRRRQSADGDLRRISDDIQKQESELTKVQSNLQYRTENKINEAIQRLETQLKTRNFRLSEEKKIVAEIDALRRSTKDLSLYLSLKKQIDEKRDQQRNLRDERDLLQKTATEIKLKEDGIRQTNQLKWEKAQIIRNDVEDFRKMIKDVHCTFNVQEKEYRQQKESLRRSKQAASLITRKEEDRWAMEEANKQEMEESDSDLGPFASEKFLCRTLIRHLQRFSAADEESTDKTTCDSLSASHGSKLDLLNESLKGEGIFLLRCKSDAEESAKLSSRVRKGKKRTPSMKKQIVHTPEIFDQFSQLRLTAPGSATEVADSIKQLKEKLASYENSSKDSLCLDTQNSVPDNMEQFSIFRGCHYKDSMASSANSYSESAVSGSMPTTPDVQFEAIRLLQASDCPRRQSQDSGTGDVDENALETGVTESCDDDKYDCLLSSCVTQGESILRLAGENALDALNREDSDGNLRAFVAASASGESIECVEL